MSAAVVTGATGATAEGGLGRGAWIMGDDRMSDDMIRLLALGVLEQVSPETTRELAAEVERLRGRLEAEEYAADTQLRETAAYIERLRARVAELETARDRARAEVERRTAKEGRLAADMIGLMQRLALAERVIEAGEAFRTARAKRIRCANRGSSLRGDGRAHQINLAVEDSAAEHLAAMLDEYSSGPEER